MKTHISKIFDSECKKRVELVSGLKLGSKIHLSATCGTGMSAVLKLLKDAGFYCTGSDNHEYSILCIQLPGMLQSDQLR